MRRSLRRSGHERCPWPIPWLYSTKMLDGTVGVDLAYHIVWARFRMMRRYLACRLDEIPRIFRMLDLISHGC